MSIKLIKLSVMILSISKGEVVCHTLSSFFLVILQQKRRNVFEIIYCNFFFFLVIKIINSRTVSLLLRTSSMFWWSSKKNKSGVRLHVRTEDLMKMKLYSQMNYKTHLLHHFLCTKLSFCTTACHFSWN